MKVYCLMAVLIANAVGCGAASPSGTAVTTDPSVPWVVMEQGLENVFAVTLGDKIIGNGFLIKQGILITNAHVALAGEYCRLTGEMCGDLRIYNNAFTADLPDTPASQSLFLDYAAYHLETEISSTETCGPPRMGELINVVGHLEDGVLISSKGRVTTLEPNRSKKPSIGYTANTVPGLSGSPVYSGTCVVGLHWGTENGFNKAIFIQNILEDL